MKYSCLLILISFLFIRCDSPKKEQTKTMNVKDIQQGPIVHDSLSSTQIEQIKHVHQTFAEVYSASLEETITNFKRDAHPDKEIQIWLTMANAYNQFKSKHPDVDSSKKVEAFQLLLLRSMMPDEQAIDQGKPKKLTKEEIAEILHNYNQSPSPVTVRKE